MKLFEEYLCFYCKNSEFELDKVQGIIFCTACKKVVGSIDKIGRIERMTSLNFKKLISFEKGVL